MNNLYKNRYRTESSRLQNWDYRWNAAYFITITAYKHQHFFGKIENEKMLVNKTGEIVANYINKIPKYNTNTIIDVSVVMPNHIHLILVLYNPKYEIPKIAYIPDNVIDGTINNRYVCSADVAPNRDVALQRLYNDANHYTTTNSEKNEIMSKISPKSGSVSVILRSFKTAVTKYVRYELQIENFDWQERFYDHIIRNKYSYKRIYDYIKTNPENWKNDKFNE